MVAVVRMPSLWASSMTISHWSAVHLLGETRARTSLCSISAPPPGRECSPAALRRRSTSGTVRPNFSDQKKISGGEKA